MSITRICLHCNLNFTVIRKADPKKYCSSSCSAKSNNVTRVRHDAKMKIVKNTKIVKTIKTKKIKSNNYRKSLNIFATLFEQTNKAVKENTVSKIILSKITGQYYNPLDVNLGWISNNKLKPAQKLAQIFNFELGNKASVDKINESIEHIRYLYDIENKSANEIATILGISNNNDFAGWIARNLGITLRNMQDAAKLYHNVRREIRNIDNSWLVYRAETRFKFPTAEYKNLPGIELIRIYGWYSSTSNLHGVSRDHMFSVNEGYKQGIDPTIISHPANCHIITHTDNIKKGSKCSISLEQLLERIKDWDAKKFALSLDPNFIPTKVTRSAEQKEKISAINKTKRNYTNGVKNIRIHMSLPCPEGFRPGMTKKNSNKSKL